nr:unnamed protein product [Callosobruchus chinensis]
MYTIYTKDCVEKKLPCASPSMYRRIFCEEYNLGFFRPRKNQCRTCMSYNTPGSINTEIIEANYQAEIVANDKAREEKKSEKKVAETSKKNILCCNFDLLMVAYDPANNGLFYIPCSECFNFTIYKFVSKKGCHGSCGIATCLYSNFKALPDNFTHIIGYSDRCGRQNLNKYVAAMCMTAVQEIPNIQ